jgi:hypothetical protein
MNTKTKNLTIRIILLTVISILTGIGCSKRTPLVIVYMPERIIHDFSDMREHEIVSWAWVRRGFVLNNCGSFKLEPVKDSSRKPNPGVVKRIEQGLNDILNDSINQNGDCEVVVRANILDVKVKPGRIKSWFTDFDNMPYIEIELLITDSTTGLPLVKVIHFSRNMKSLNTAVADVLSDLRQFFTMAL